MLQPVRGPAVFRRDTARLKTLRAAGYRITYGLGGLPAANQQAGNESEAYVAHLKIPDEDRTIDDEGEIQARLGAGGIEYQKWTPDPPLEPGAPDDTVLAAYAGKIEEFKQRGGYVKADVISVTPDTPGLQEMMAKFAQEHMHGEDEVRFIVEGHGLLHVHPEEGPILALEVEPGDLISVPAGTLHWFVLCSDQQVRAVRLFQNPEGWVPNYTESGLETRYEPVCFGPHYSPAGSATS